jgi:ABC-2 type transport system permease protein
MRTLRLHLIAAAGIAERDLRVFASYRLRPVMLVLAPLASVTLFYYVSRLVTVESLGSSDGYFAYVVAGIAALDVLAATLGAPSALLRQELVAGTFERLVLSPFGAVRSLVAMMAFPFLQALTVASFTVLFAAVAFGMSLAWPRILLGPPAALLAAVAFAPLGLMLLAGVLVMKQALVGASIIVTALSIVAGAYFPTELLPDWLEWLSEVQPFTPALNLLRYVISSNPATATPWNDVAELATFAAVLLPPALWMLTRALAHSRRRGTVTEY